MKYDVITIGGSTEDISFYVDDYVLIDKDDVLKQKMLAFEYGSKINIKKTYISFGGGAANTAVALASLGFKVASLTLAGGDGRGDRIVKNLKKRGVSGKLVKRIKSEISAFSFIIIGRGNEHIVFSNRAVNSQFSLTNKDLKNLKKTKWLYLTSLSGKWEAVLKGLFSVTGPKIIWNPGERQLKEGYSKIAKYFKRLEVLTLNKDEAMELVTSYDGYKNRSLKFLNSSRNLLNVIHSWGPKIVIVTNGQHGADAYDGKTFYHQPIVKNGPKVDTTGVGDAFGSSFVAGLEFYKDDIKKAMYLAAANAASVVSEQGAQNGLLTKKDLKRKGLL